MSVTRSSSSKGYLHLSRDFMALLCRAGLSTRNRGCYSDLLIEAAWKDHKRPRGLQLKGEAPASERWWAKRWKVSQGGVHKLLVKLQKMEWIKRTADNAA